MVLLPWLKSSEIGNLETTAQLIPTTYVGATVPILVVREAIAINILSE
jgi:hypothetical protein